MHAPRHADTRPRQVGQDRLAGPALALLAALLAWPAAAGAQGPALDVGPVPADRAATADEAGRLPVAAMERGGLFLPSDRPGYVIPATTVGADVEIDVAGPIARATVRQTFVNPTDGWIEGVYVFPLPEDSAVDRLRLIVGDRVIEGEIHPREEAERIYEEAAEAGQQASLVSQERPNIFTNSVANIPPRGSLTVEIAYQETLRFDSGIWSLRFPTVILPRYIPGEPIAPLDRGWAPDTTQVPDASRITPPVAAPGTGPINPVSFAIRLDAGLPLESVESPTHKLTVDGALSDGEVLVGLATDQAWADRDLVVNWRPAAGAVPAAALFRETIDGMDHDLLVLMPPAEINEAVDTPREVVLIIDTSGSMSGQSMEQARAALLVSLDRLGPEDRFNIISFDDTAYRLFNKAVPADGANLGAGRNFVRGLVADGGTEMRGALDLALDGRSDPSRLRQIVFVTDGSVGNEAELLGMIDRRLGDSRLFTVGIGSAPNSFFMTEAAEMGRGSFTYVDATEQVEARMGELFTKLEHPALTDIALSWPGATVPEVYPATLPDLYVGEPVVATLRVPGGSSGDIVVTGRIGDEEWRTEIPLSSAPDAEGVAALWARAKITEIERGGYRGDHPDEVRADVVEVALQYRLVSDYTSLVAVDPTVVRPPEAAMTTDAVATNMPDGVDMQMAEVAPESLRAIRAMAATGSPFGFDALPMGATPAALNLLLGAACLMLAGLLLLLARRPVRFRA